ncbi:MAG: aminoacyltransferase [Desulfobulbaceae bacterium]|nr:MAG: aminoacyltransferase [Desulfobulbaceae bacterium]
MADPQAMTLGVQELQERLRQLEEQIAETRRRLPAHSVKPPVMMELLELEDQRDLLLRRIDEMRRG